MSFIINVLWEWLKRSQFIKGTATAALGTSVGFIAIIGFVKDEIQEVNLSVDKKIEISERKIEVYHEFRREFRDAQLRQMHNDFQYLRSAIDETNRNVLKILENKRRGN